MKAPERVYPPIVWLGGKSALVPWILAQIPPHQAYVEPFGGAGAVLLAKKPSQVEVFNDINGDIVALFRVLRDPRISADLETRMALTLYSRDEFNRAKRLLKRKRLTLVDRVWAFFVVHSQSVNGKAVCWARNLAQSGGGAPRWAVRIKRFQTWRERLASVQIEHRPALDVIRAHDSPATVFYLDPPYHPGTRSEEVYRHEMSAAHHRKLVALLLTLRGHVILSGYPHPDYQPLLDAGWRVLRKRVNPNSRNMHGKHSTRRDEFLYLSPTVLRQRRGIPLAEKILRVVGQHKRVTMRVLRQYTHRPMSEILSAVEALIEGKQLRQVETVSRNRNQRQIVIYRLPPGRR